MQMAAQLRAFAVFSPYHPSSLYHLLPEKKPKRLGKHPPFSDALLSST